MASWLATTPPLGAFLFMRRMLAWWVPPTLLFLAWVNPNHYPPWVNFHAEFLALLSVAVAALALGLREPALIAVKIPYAAVAAASVVALPWVYWIGGSAPFVGDALVSSAFIAALAIAIIVGANGAQPHHSRPDWMPMAVALVAGALVSAGIGVLQWLDLEGPVGVFVAQADAADRAMGNLAQPNQMASLLIIGVVSWRLLQQDFRLHVLIDGAVMLALTWALVLSQSRAGMVSVALVTGFMLWKAPGCNPLRTRLVWAGWFLLFLLGLVVLPAINQYFDLPTTRSTLGGVSDRLTLWSVALAGLVESPWIGYGWNQTGAANWVGSLAVPAVGYFTYAHNLALDLMLWLGIPLGLMLSVALGWWFVTRALRVSQPLGIYACAMLIPVGFHSMVEFPFAYAYFLVTAGWLAGLLETCVDPNAQWRVRPPVVVLSAGVLVVALVYGALDYLKAEEDYRVVRFENLRVGSTSPDYIAPDINALTQLKALLQALRIQPRPDMPDHDIDLLRKTSDHFVHSALKLRYAFAAGLNGDPSGAQRALLQLKNTHGRDYYKGVLELWATRSERYPQLKAVPPP